MAKFRYRSFRRPFDPRWRFMTGFQDPKRILDLGCGGGGNCIDFRRLYPHAEIYGVDILEQGPTSFRYQKVDLDHGKLPFDEEFFDIVTLTHVIEHLRTPDCLGSGFIAFSSRTAGFTWRHRTGQRSSRLRWDFAGSRVVGSIFTTTRRISSHGQSTDFSSLFVNSAACALDGRNASKLGVCSARHSQDAPCPGPEPATFAD